MTLPENDEDKYLLIGDYLKAVADSVAERGWTVNKTAVLSLFSYNKLDMYTDLVLNKDKIAAHPVIRTLSGESILDGINSSELDMELDGVLKTGDSYCVADADSSQLNAVVQMKKGKSFVLQGPPGTGKSQTITNIIAEGLAAGKKVLFVSEKQAALNVVFRNLDRAGLEDFCLELHSAKANKSEVIRELNETLNTEKSRVTTAALGELGALSENVEQLNSYVTALHTPIEKAGMTPYIIFSGFMKSKNYPDPDFKLEKIESRSLDDLNNYRIAIGEYLRYAEIFGADYKAAPFWGYVNTDKSLEKPKKLETLFQKLLGAIDYYLEQDSAISVKLGYPVSVFPASSEKLILILNILNKVKPAPAVWLIKEGRKTAIEEIKRIREKQSQYNNFLTEFSKRFDLSVLDNDFAEMEKRFRSKYGSFTRIFNKEYKGDKNLVNSYLLSGKLSFEEMRLYVYKFRKAQEDRKFFNENELKLVEALGNYYLSMDTDCAAAEEQLGLIDKLTELSGGKLSAEIAMFITEGVPENLGKEAQTLAARYNYLRGLIQEVMKDYDAALYDFRYGYAEIKKKLTACNDSLSKLSDWINFTGVISDIKNQGLGDFVIASARAKLPHKDWFKALEKKFYYLWTDKVITTDQVLGAFSREKHETILKSFRDKDKLALRIAQARIREKLSAARPNGNSVTAESETGILRLEAQKKKRQMSVRMLFEQIPHLIMRLKPCLLMSPITVSRFINPDIIKFDLIVFDEASQIFPEDALGAIYRGTQLIVVGDSEQLPPTNFFNSAASDSDYDDENAEFYALDTESLESILDVANASLNRIKLKWHYRSRFEELIAFSNMHIYNNELISFPAARKCGKDSGVEYIYVEKGIYDRSGTRTNKEEAERVAEEVMKHYASYPDRSLGVVAFSEAQQEAVDSAVARLRLKRPEMEAHFSETVREPFFVKNIESVQGDERDTIIFSVGYARDVNGKMYMNFGPLSREGGERRLNVAVTRARINVKLIGSIHASDIKADSTLKGVRLLRDYIDYAEKGAVALGVQISDSAENDIIASVKKRLEGEGYLIDSAVGCGGYRVDLAVKNPDDPDNYVIGIEFDGENYRSCRNARDRDRLRSEVLIRLNWKLYRIWSADWIKRTDTEEKRLIDAVSKAFSESAGNAKAKDSALSTEAKASDADQPAEEPLKLEIVRKNAELPLYSPVDPIPIIHTQRGTKNRFKAVMDAVMLQESPVHFSTVMERVMPIFGATAVTDELKEQFKKEYALWKPANVLYKAPYFYLSDRPVKFRKSAEGIKRDVKFLNNMELSDGLLTLIANNVGISREGLVKEMSTALGYGRVAPSVTTAVNKAVDALISEGRLIVDNEKLRLK